MISLRTAVLIACACATSAAELDPLSDAFIDLINSKQTTWKAGRNFPHINHMKPLLGVLPEFNVDSLENFEHDAEFIASLPVSFDPRQKWPYCPSLSEIRDQGACGSCWAFGAVEAMTDRVCTYSNGRKQFHFSAEDLLDCCSQQIPECGGCAGGHPDKAWNYWKTSGLVSGGNYNSNQGCKPYSFTVCDHTSSGKLPMCISNEVTPYCSRSCVSGYGVAYEQDKQYGKSVYAIKGGEEHIMAELYKNGPVEATFMLYRDFGLYRSGVYQHYMGEFVGQHAVKIIGWGVENGTKYWLIANSWNKQWAELGGFFKMLRGVNHCNIESNIVAGEPLFKN